jgi:hypothetical protein
VPVLSRLLRAGRSGAACAAHAAAAVHRRPPAPAASGPRSPSADGAAVHATSRHSPASPVLRANPFPEVSDLICRLPLPTLFYRLEADHLGHLMRFGYDLAGESNSVTRRFKGPTERTGHRRNRGVLREQRPYLRLNRFQGVRLSSRKENSTPGTVRLASRVPLRCRAGRPEGRPSPRPGYGILTVFPFTVGHIVRSGRSKSVRFWFRIG